MLFNSDLFVISAKTSNHVKYIKFIEINFKKKYILVEKPLSNYLPKLKIKNNFVYVGYNLRFHPVIQYVSKKMIPKLLIRHCIQVKKSGDNVSVIIIFL